MRGLRGQAKVKVFAGQEWLKEEGELIGRFTTLSLSLLALVRGVPAADAPPPFVKVALETGKVGAGSPPS